MLMLRLVSARTAMIVTSDSLPITLSSVEGCAQSSRYNIIKIGIVEGWNDELMRLKTQYSNIPIFQHPISVMPLRSF